MLPEYRHFEICNGSGGTTMYPAAKAAAGFDEEKFWDVVLAHRAKHGLQPLFGHGSDDAHWYSWQPTNSKTEYRIPRQFGCRWQSDMICG